MPPGCALDAPPSENLRSLAAYFMDGVNEQHLPASGQSLRMRQMTNAGFHRRVVEKVWTKAQDAFPNDPLR